MLHAKNVQKGAKKKTPQKNLPGIFERPTKHSRELSERLLTITSVRASLVSQLAHKVRQQKASSVAG